MANLKYNAVSQEKRGGRFSNSDRTRKLILLSVLTALVIVLSFIKIPLGPFTVTLVLPVIVIGAALCGIWAGGWLGAVFSVMVFVVGDAAAFLAVNIPATILVVMLKGTCAGLAAGLIYHVITRNGKHKTLAAISSAVAAPIVNTGIFSIGCLLFFFDTISSWGMGEGFTSGVSYLFLGMIGLNFIVEFSINIVLTPVIIRLIDLVVKKKFAH